MSLDVTGNKLRSFYSIFKSLSLETKNEIERELRLKGLTLFEGLYFLPISYLFSDILREIVFKEIEEKDLCLYKEVWSFNITHNVRNMAEKAGIPLWDDNINGSLAMNLIDPVIKGIKNLKNSPLDYKTMEKDPEWGSYEDLLFLIEVELLPLVLRNPESIIFIWK